MNDLLGSTYQPKEEQLKAKKWMKIIGIILALLFLICIVLIVLMYYIKATQLKITLDGKPTADLENILIIQENEIYVPIRKFAGYVGYQSYSGDYKQYAEDNTKCYVQSNYEIASFTMNSDKIYKLLVNGNDYEYFTINEPITMRNGELYTTMEGAERAFNISFNYDKEKNQITIYTLPYLVQQYSSQFRNSAVAGDGSNLSNQKALLDNRLIVRNTDGYFGVSDLTGQEILGTKYTSIKYIESTREFIVTTAENKMGIMSYDAITKISPDYDEIKQIDKDTGLYLVRNGNKQGVINNAGSIIIYLDYDQIGIDSGRFTTQNIKNQYLLYDNCIPVKKGNLWGIFDKNGQTILPIEYDDFGCSAGGGSSTTQTTNNILLIPEYKGIVVRQKDLYGIKDFEGKDLIPIALKSIYSTTAEGKETYYMIYNEQVMNVITYIQTYVKPTNNSTNENNQNNMNATENNTANNEVNNNAVTNDTQTSNNTNTNGQTSNGNQQQATTSTNANTVSTSSTATGTGQTNSNITNTNRNTAGNTNSGNTNNNAPANANSATTNNGTTTTNSGNRNNDIVPSKPSAGNANSNMMVVNANI